MRERLESILTIAVVSLLVWLYAESRVVTQYNNLPITIAFESRSGAPINYEGTGRIQVSFKASPSIKREFDRIAEQPVTITVDDTLPDLPDLRTLVLAETLDNTDFAELGLVIEDTSPPTARIEIIRRRKLILPVRLETDGFQLTEPPVIEPAEAEITLPESIQLPDNTSALVRLSLDDIAGFDTGTQRAQNAPIIIPADAESPWTTIQPANARITYTVRQTRDTVELPTVPVRINILVSLADDFTLTIPEAERFIPSILLIGPADALQQVRDQPNSVWVELRPTRDQLEAAADAQPPTLELTPVLVAPPGVTTEDGSLPATTLDIARRTNAAPR
ncbi:YbbR-like domain-containing protein [Mucisphaera calidilacus]|uniref:YbbR-like protein n=1 Tax=Mucisphaera calidilacus TaxID=2527982 RepID=A0A518BYQ2_9BACT|nr:hypothetical protein [Mucisphaera calidilacus]QDU72101.1 hypothetical protein Pan265_19630 [Mucisphaera calidilacus]